jgi:hypothetical protein
MLSWRCGAVIDSTNSGRRSRSASECPTAKFRRQLMLEVDHKRMSAATGSGLERPLVPVLDLAAERDEQRQPDLGPSRR